MFGYVRARQDTMSASDRESYEAAYCGLCHQLGSKYGLVARMFLNYDFTFLAMVLAPADSDCKAECLVCPRHPIKGKRTCLPTPWLELAAGESVILTWWKLRDGVQDGGFWKALAGRFLCLLLRPAYGKAREAHPDFDRQTKALLEELSRLEGENCPSLDRTADCFARLLQGAVPESGNGDRNRVLAQLFYHLGRWIYLIDGVDDWKEDQKTGNYNPVLARFPEWTQEDREYLRHSLDLSLERVGAAFQLLEPTPYTGVLENVIYSGLPGVEDLVFSGKWRERPHRENRKGESTP